MCGHAGFARHPQGKGFKACKRVLNETIQGIEHRGRHATGFAAVGGSSDFIFKIAMPIGELIRTKRWQSEVEKIKDDTRVVMGHTRWATLPNAHVDSAAHPFTFGRTVGAHNGIISNWKQIAERENQKWEVDSEAAIYLLDKHDDAADALKQLYGDFALIWTKGGKLNMARNHKRPLVLAYVPKFRALFWCSEREPLVKALRGAGVTTKQMEVYHLSPMLTYTFDTDRFDDDGSHAVRTEFGTPPVIATTSSKAVLNPRGVIDVVRAQRERAVQWENGDPEPYESWIERMKRERDDEQTELPLRKKSKSKSSSVKSGSTLAEMLNNMQETIEKQSRTIAKLVERVQALDAECESNDAEIKFLFSVIDSAGLLTGNVSDDDESDESENVELEPPF